jgi:hypothetical protein
MEFNRANHIACLIADIKFIEDTKKELSLPIGEIIIRPIEQDDDDVVRSIILDSYTGQKYFKILCDTLISELNQDLKEKMLEIESI